MEALPHQRSDVEALDTIDEAVDALTTDRLRLDTDRDLLNLLDRSVTVLNRLHAWQATLAASIEKTEAAWTAHGTSTRTWLTQRRNLTPRDAARLITTSEHLDRFGHVAEAATSGTILTSQADAIADVLNLLPDDLATTHLTKAETTMIGYATTHNATELRRLTTHLVEIIDPHGADEREAIRLEQEHRRAQRSRYLTLTPDHHGAILIRGSLPVADAEPFRRLINAHAAQTQRGLDRIDPHRDPLTPAMHRADGLLAMITAHQQTTLAPSHGGDRPRIVITLDHQRLQQAAHNAGILTGSILATGEPLDAGTLRRMLCDADILPVIMNTNSEVLDIGRSQRLVTPTIRAGLDQRDQGCAFPGCDKPPEACHAHHITPWWAGGTTTITNLVLVCPHHHGIIEPGHDPTADRWRIRLRHGTGHPEVIPPQRVDPHQRPRQHTRYRRPSPPG
ncbi:MAG: DUF222 domain-containing protein [Propioniciclava sp.]